MGGATVPVGVYDQKTWLQMTECTIQDSRESGVQVSGKSTLQMDSCTIRGSQFAAVEVTKGGRASAFQCIFENNRTGIGKVTSLAERPSRHFKTTKPASSS